MPFSAVLVIRRTFWAGITDRVQHVANLGRRCIRGDPCWRVFTGDIDRSLSHACGSPPTAKDAPTRDEIVAAFESATRSQAENSEPPSDEALFRQFQAWATEKDARAQVGPVQH